MGMFEERATEQPVVPEDIWLPDDELTQEWLQMMQQYRVECDAADRARLENLTDRTV